MSEQLYVATREFRSRLLLDKHKLTHGTIELPGRGRNYSHSKLGEPVETFKIIGKRTFALIILRVSGTLAGGSIAGVELWQAALLAAFIGVMDVAESLSRSYVVDGDLSINEINRAFASSAEAELSSKEQEAPVAPIVAAAAVAVAAPLVVEEIAEIVADDEIEFEEVDAEEAQ